jgi:hypothetical protein
MSQTTDGRDEARSSSNVVMCTVCGRILFDGAWVFAGDSEHTEILADAATLSPGPCPACRGPRSPNPFGGDSRLRAAAIDLITDQGVLVEMARTEDDAFVRRAALRRLTGQALLALPRPRRHRRLQFR